MGTNYFCYEQACPCCKREGDRLHIGKSSGGWHFSLHVVPERGLNDLDAWIEFLKDKPIRNEYDDKVTLPKLISIITEREWERKGPDVGPEWYGINNAERGLNGLVRHKIDGAHCVGHGNGTWDLIAGDFS